MNPLLLKTESVWLVIDHWLTSLYICLHDGITMCGAAVAKTWVLMLLAMKKKTHRHLQHTTSTVQTRSPTSLRCGLVSWLSLAGSGNPVMCFTTALSKPPGRLHTCAKDWSCTIQTDYSQSLNSVGFSGIRFLTSWSNLYSRGASNPLLHHVLSSTDAGWTRQLLTQAAKIQEVAVPIPTKNLASHEQL